jgi:two-component system chemotaxis response regulator CheB
MKEIRVLVVDDSVFLRRTIPLLLESDTGIEVVGTAANGVEAVEMTKKLKPDVITLDVIMPEMDGLTALKHIMNEVPTPVVMLSSITYQGAYQTVEALSLGAVDCIAKPSGQVSFDIDKIREEIIEKVKIASTSRVGIMQSKQNKESSIELKESSHTVATKKKSFRRKELVVIATSTGGPAALAVVLSQLPKDVPGLIIVQHIAEGFNEALAQRLNSISPLEIRVIKNYDEIVPGVGLLAPAGMQLTVKRVDGKLYTVLSKEPMNLLYRPSADVLFSSVAQVCGAAACAVIMTGMGDDGAKGIKKIKERGGTTIAQDEATSVIFGMPREAINIGGIDIIAPLNQIANEIIKAL